MSVCDGIVAVGYEALCCWADRAAVDQGYGVASRGKRGEGARGARVRVARAYFATQHIELLVFSPQAENMYLQAFFTLVACISFVVETYLDPERRGMPIEEAYHPFVCQGFTASLTAVNGRRIDLLARFCL